MKDPIIVFENVTKSYPYYGYIISGFKNFLFNFPKAIKESKKRFVALRNISFQVYRGECFGIIGKNGAGKSTLLGLVAGVLKPDSGKILVKGRISPLLELGAGFHPELTGKENIILNAVLLGMGKKEILKEIDKIIDFSELREFIDQPIRTYSSGMIARLGFSIAIHLNHEILLIDEILSVGDISFQKKCIDKILNFKKNGVTILLVTHSPKDLVELCDRAMLINNHEIKIIGKPEEVIKVYSELIK
jgi:lipopolysaccharide transport system ATP-binding protein